MDEERSVMTEVIAAELKRELDLPWDCDSEKVLRACEGTWLLARVRVRLALRRFYVRLQWLQYNVGITLIRAYRWCRDHVRH